MLFKKYFQSHVRYILVTLGGGGCGRERVCVCVRARAARACGGERARARARACVCVRARVWGRVCVCEITCVRARAGTYIYIICTFMQKVVYYMCCFVCIQKLCAMHQLLRILEVVIVVCS
jgi:hypothetical protein